MNYTISIQTPKYGFIEWVADTYEQAWALFNLACEEGCYLAVDLVDNSTGEVFASTDEEWA